MTSSASESSVVQMGKLAVHIAENGHSYELDCDECTPVESVQKYLESLCRIPVNDQLLLCGADTKLEPHCQLSAYKLPAEGREVFLFNKSRMRSSSPLPPPEQIEIIDIPNPSLLSPSKNAHPLDNSADPALKALPSYERQFRYHFQCGNAIYSRTHAKFDVCGGLLREQRVQERALEIARGNLEFFYKIVLQTYADFMKCYSQQHRGHTSLLANFGRDMERLRSVKLHPSLQTGNRKCLLDFVKEENLRKVVEDCGNSHRQFENKVSEFKQEFGDLKRNVENLFTAGQGWYLVKEMDMALKEHQHVVNEQKSIMQALSKDVNTVKKLVDDCLSGELELSSSLRPHDAVSALGPIYDSHEKNYLPKMQSCDSAISSLLDFCRNTKNETNIFVHNYMQKVTYIQHTIKNVRYKFSVFQEALNRQNEQFHHLKVVRGIGTAYRACLAEVVRRKSEMKIYIGKAGRLAEKLATERELEIGRRDEFSKVHSTFIPRDILASMGLYDTPNPCNVNVTPFDTSLLDIELSDIDRFAPESVLGVSCRSGFSRASNSGEIEASAAGFNDECDFGLSIENAKLKAELASKIALLCSMSAELDYESLDESRLDNVLKIAADKTSDALHLKEEYEKRLESVLKAKQMQCESYEKRIRELEQRLSDQYGIIKLKNDEDASERSGVSTAKTDDNKSEVLEEGFGGSSSLKSGLDNNMADSSMMLNPQLDSSMVDLQIDNGQTFDQDNKKGRLVGDEDMVLASSNMAVSMSQPYESGLDAKLSDAFVIELQKDLDKKSSQLEIAELKIEGLVDEVSKLGKELEMSQKLLDESQMNCAHLENSLHEARKEAQTNLCAADRRSLEYSSLRISAVKMRGHFERLKNCVLSAGVANFSNSLHDLAQSIGSVADGSEDDGTAEFRECLCVLADKVGVLLRQRAELLDRHSKIEAANEQLSKELDEKSELVNTLYFKHQLEKKQANKEKISFGRLEVHEIAVFILTSTGFYEAINHNNSYYFLSSESLALFTDNLTSQPNYIIGQIVHIDRRTVKSTPSLTSERAGDTKDRVDFLTSESTPLENPYGLTVGCEYFVVTIVMLPDTIHSPPS
ncbi:hypothetical protein STAS_24036 [Striga asiatica]|uniref:Uncharacterized protein n=1 Tax=Striga asiatica TaxID=4170 RepID=A0A5A7QNM8_STRAF|nr:hypothetical protein STAS_24036 [Striga asiatica]